MNHFRHPFPLLCVALLPFIVPTPAAADYLFYMDRFLVAKGFPNGTSDPFTIFTPGYVKFFDDFSAGGPPPDLTGVINADQDSNLTADFSYGVNVTENGTVGPEVAYQGFQDLLSLNSADAVLHTGADGGQSMRQFQILNAESGTGLGKAVTFAVGGSFQWVIPDQDQMYAIQVQDRRTGVPGDDIISLRVRGLGGGLVQIQLRRSVYDDSNGLALGNQTLDSRTISAPDGAAFIFLSLIHPTASTDQLYAGWSFADASSGYIAGSLDGFSTPAEIFHGDTSGYRAAFFAAEPVPEAQTWSMLLAGVGLVGWVSRRRRK